MRSTVILIFSFSVSFAQLSVPFKTRYQDMVKGDMTIIANNIVNRVDYNNSSNDAYYNQTKFSKLNDEFDMEYIDIDDDESTFSSSSAELIFDNKSNKKVVYAALYWSANYKYNVGIQKNEDKFVAQDKGRESFDTVKLKLPNQDEYIDVAGEIIFDGINEYNDFAPYAAYADITDYITNLPSADGVYTVANIKATQGKINGGVAAGWTIFIVYEDKTMTKKFISSQDGFMGISEKPIDIVFNGFESPSTGSLKAKIAGAVLEGDNNILGDKLLFSSNKSNTFTSLNNSLRPENNFFNSSISIENQNFMNRFPDSKNTLGYDSFLYTIPNQNNAVIENNSTESKIRVQSDGDKSFMFFTAFNIDLTPNLEPEKTEELVSNLQESNNQAIKFVPINNDLVVDDNKMASVINRIQKNNALATNNSIEIQTMNSSIQPSGYYIMANIFKTEQRTEEFIFYLKTKDITADFFINPLNNYFYVYLRKLDNLQDAINLYQSKLDATYKERMQIVSINNENKFTAKTIEPVVVNTKKPEIITSEKIAEVKVRKPTVSINKKVVIKPTEKIAAVVTKPAVVNIKKVELQSTLAEVKTKEPAVVIHENVAIQPTEAVAAVKSQKEELIVKETKSDTDIEKEPATTSQENYYSEKLAQTIIKINKARALNDLHSANIPNVQSGYYVVANVFLVNENSINFMSSLKTKGLRSKVLVNSSNGYKYIYLKKVNTEEEARALLLNKFNDKYESKLWILSVNNISLVTDND